MDIMVQRCIAITNVGATNGRTYNITIRYHRR